MSTRTAPPFQIAPIPDFCGGFLVHNVFASPTISTVALVRRFKATFSKGVDLIQDVCDEELYEGSFSAAMWLAEFQLTRKALRDAVEEVGFKPLLVTTNPNTGNKCTLFVAELPTEYGEPYHG